MKQPIIDYEQLQADHDAVIDEAKRINAEWHKNKEAYTHIKAMAARGVPIYQTAMNRIYNGEQQRLDLHIAIAICQEYEATKNG